MRYQISILIVVITIIGLFPMAFAQVNISPELEKEIEQTVPGATIRLLVQLKPGGNMQEEMEKIRAKYDPRSLEIFEVVRQLDLKHNPLNQMTPEERRAWEEARRASGYYDQMTFEEQMAYEKSGKPGAFLPDLPWSEEDAKLREQLIAESNAIHDARIQEIYALAEKINAPIQNEFVQWVQSKGGEAHVATDLLNMIAVGVPVNLVQEIRNHPSVVSVELDRAMPILPIPNKNPLTSVDFKDFLFYIGIAVALLIFIFGSVRILKE